jgi:HD-GYP domain-containing protein (c-di-GMP phosphodiesterase class II)
MRRTHPFHVLTATLFFLVTLAVGGGIGVVAYTQQRQLLLAAVADVFARSLRESQSELAATYLPVQAQIALLATAFREAPFPELAERYVPVLSRVLESSPVISSMAIQRGSTAHLTLTPLPHAEARRRIDAPASAAFRLDLAQPSGIITRYFDAALAPLGPPRANQARRQPDSGPSLMVSHAADNGKLILRASISLKNLSAILSRQRATPSTQLAMLNASGQLLAASHGAWSDEANRLPAATLGDMDLPILAAVVAQPVRDRIIAMEIDGRRWQTLAQTGEIAPGVATLMVMAAPHDEVLAGANQVLRQTLAITVLGLGLMLPLIWWLSRRISDPLRRLAKAASDVRAFRFSGESPRSVVDEVDALSRAMQQMRVTIQRFLDISARLAAERHYDQLLEEIVDETIAAATAGAGAVYLFEENRQLRPMAWRWMDGTPPLSPGVVLPQDAPAFAAALSRPGPSQTVLLPGHLQAGLEWLGAWFPGQATHLLMVPLRNRTGETLGVLLLARSAKSGAYEEDLVDFIDALSGTMAITIEKQSLLAGRKALLDGVIRMIAGAIDARSPHTSGHCQRVPQLVAMLADAAATHPASPYRHAPLGESAREALHLAAWLHDCGKLFVPDYVTDKSVKLEAVFNRIHEIRTRFEVLKRDAEIGYWRALAGGGDAASLRRELDAAHAALDADFAFVAACNLGDRALDDSDIARLVRIGERPWLRTLDDRIGISELELRIKAGVPARALPAHEHLLADRLEHLVGDYPVAGDNEATGIRRTMPQPRHRLNLGELHCLSIRSGTLTAEERYLINAHILGTIAMLSTLPFPPELASVPEMAGSHHEHLDGSGYPYGRKAEELSLAARIIAIADVFEALTATDRPYKPGKSDEDALAIMADMARRRHLDPELFDLFARAGIPARYAATRGGVSAVDETANAGT